MSGQFCRAEAKLAAPVAVRLAPQNLDKTKDKIIIIPYREKKYTDTTLDKLDMNSREFQNTERKCSRKRKSTYLKLTLLFSGF